MRMWRSSPARDEHQACHAPPAGLDKPLIHSERMPYKLKHSTRKRQEKHLDKACYYAQQSELFVGLCQHRLKYKVGWNESHKRIRNLCLNQGRLGCASQLKLSAIWMPTIFRLNGKWSGTSLAFLLLFVPALDSCFTSSQTHVSSLIFCITLFQLMSGDIHIPAVHIFLRCPSFDMLCVCLR